MATGGAGDDRTRCMIYDVYITTRYPGINTSRTIKVYPTTILLYHHQCNITITLVITLSVAISLGTQ